MPLTADDRVEIEMLGARYNHAIDFHDHEAWADTFLADGCFISPQGRWDGRWVERRRPTGSQSL